MNIIKNILALSVSLFSTLASASLVVTNNGFIDSAHSLEWLAPSKVTSLSDYNAYVAAGWEVATSSDIILLTGNYFFALDYYSAFDQSVFDGFKTIDNTGNVGCQGVTFFCSAGWYHNVGTNGEDYRYEFGWVGLGSNPIQTDPKIVQQYKLDLASSLVMSTVDGSSLYGFSGAYDTFMVRAVPIPDAAWLFSSSLIGLASTIRKRKFA